MATAKKVKTTPAKTPKEILTAEAFATVLDLPIVAQALADWKENEHAKRVQADRDAHLRMQQADRDAYWRDSQLKAHQSVFLTSQRRLLWFAGCVLAVIGLLAYLSVLSKDVTASLIGSLIGYWYGRAESKKHD